MVMVFELHTAETPAGKPVAAPIPVAPVVEWVMLGESSELIHKVGVDEAGLDVLVGETVIPIVLAVPFPQAFEGVTVILPEPAPTVTVTELEVPPAFCVHPDGNDHA
ncbi:MAG: hypothetical protein A2066_13155 [Bacteroidetes bacterium GWB2_41_8]|nr:MAG: hypothetical protein A2066_13155 [Bacteroidetes bacterium GWB2_41_8]